MDISFSTIPGNLNTTIGYGVAGFNMVRSLQKLGHRVPFADKNCKIEIFFSQPDYWEWSNQFSYHIGYTPWESTGLPAGWLEQMNLADEVWTTSEIIRRWYTAAGVKNVKVYPHGIDPQWTPKKRNVYEKMRFLHMGEPAPRKGGQMAVDAFRAAFGDSSDVELTVKAHRLNNTRRIFDGRILGPITDYNNVRLVTQELPEDHLVSFVKSYHVMVYPSWGEGFGLIPFQAIATGMPTICTEKWAQYRSYLGPLGLDSKLTDSPWPGVHPGKMLEPSFDDLVDKYRYAYDNFDELSNYFYAQAPKLHEEYNWETLTEKAFAHLI
ncbi:glycosyltransferase [Streptomyces phage Paradiddles]|uniref:Glycosyltransferase n=1 Tax=Streptomyces phage Paradiddles TaxID=2023993 RepID=A0A222Z0Q7_9CAUD|nr:glycosyltransferase [Streptomyces phage Paradiddles]ASR77527.1 glycosyltransferase [Streptomyces phage Paradiddles]UOW93472.1 glycosyltransferase [Streptomyces phage Squillium]WNM73304.1 glycosyltransferase [Streptomyces phage Liandry]WNM74702.1 glycosyltransferase [Streptomyces phage PinkiePie]